jgi:hypothetical protein
MGYTGLAKEVNHEIIPFGTEVWETTNFRLKIAIYVGYVPPPSTRHKSYLQYQEWTDIFHKRHKEVLKVFVTIIS